MGKITITVLKSEIEKISQICKDNESKFFTNKIKIIKDEIMIREQIYKKIGILDYELELKLLDEVLRKKSSSKKNSKNKKIYK